MNHLHCIQKITNDLIETYQTRCPFAISEAKGIKIKYCNDFHDLKGAHVIIAGTPYIFLKADLEEQEKKLVCAHELGHDILHNDVHVSSYSFSSLSDNRMLEREANIFAAHLLIDDNQIDELIRSGYELSQVAAILEVDEQLALFKINEMIRRGYRYKLNRSPSPFFLK